MKISRRNFLKGSATTLFLAGFNFPVLANTDKKKNLVVIMLRGGMDGLCAVPIIGDKNFEKRRKDLILDRTIKLDSDFALHPKLKNFHNLWKKNLGAVVHATRIRGQLGRGSRRHRLRRRIQRTHVRPGRLGRDLEKDRR